MTPNKKRESLAEFLFKEPRRPFSRYCVFADYLRIFLLFFRLSRRYTISSIYIYFFFRGRKTIITQNAIPPELYLPRHCGVPLKKAEIHGNIFGATDKSIRLIYQPDHKHEKRLGDERYKQHPHQLEKGTNSRATDV